MTPAFQVVSAQLQERYEVRAFPTVILFVSGQERNRWVMHYAIDDYRRALDAIVGPAARSPGEALRRPGQP